MTEQLEVHWSAFEGYRLLADGAPMQVAAAVKRRMLAGPDAPVLVFDRSTGQQLDLDLRGTVDDVERWTERVISHVPTPMPRAPEEAERRGPGRKKLGVVSREITLLPRHWEWLGTQPGGASATLRKLVDEARTRYADRDRIRAAQERTYRFVSAIGGNLAGFEEATRALFAGDAERFMSCLSGWPSDIRAVATDLSAGAFGEAPAH